MASSTKPRLKRAQPKKKNAVDPQSRMLASLEISGFRGFKTLSVSGLAPVNIVTGMNGAGKTTFLEAALAIHGRLNPAWLLGLQAHRGFERMKMATGPNYLGVFYGFRDTGEASILGTWTDEERHRLVIERSKDSKRSEIPSSSRSLTGVETPPGDLVFKAFQGSKLVHESAAAYSNTPPDPPQLIVKNGKDAERRAVLLHPSDRAAGSEETERFGNAKIEGRTDRIVDGIKILDSRVKDIEFVNTSAGAFFAARIESSVVPLGLLGGGVNNVFRFLVALNDVRGGMLAIDEIENGIHHSRYEEVISVLVRCALEDGTQLMLSTHSAEALEAAGRACEDLPMGTLSVVNLARTDGDAVEAHVFRGKDAVSSLQLGYELR